MVGQSSCCPQPRHCLDVRCACCGADLRLTIRVCVIAAEYCQQGPACLVYVVETGSSQHPERYGLVGPTKIYWRIQFKCI